MNARAARRRGLDIRQTRLDPEFWYPLAMSARLPRGGTQAVEWAGEPIVLWRSDSGEVHALEDRCPHRQFPLHRGRVAGETLACGYHGWRFGGDGRCQAIPGRPDVAPARMRVRRHRCREAHGLVFVHPGSGPEPTFPFIPGVEPSRRLSIPTGGPVGCHPSFLFENLFDMTHQVLHRRWMGNVEAETLGLREGEDWVEVRYRLHRSAGRMGLGGRLALGGDAGDGTLATMTVRTAYPYQLLDVSRPGHPEPAIRVWTAYTPVGREGRACHALGLVSIRRPRVPGVMALLAPLVRRFNEAIFAEDRAAVEAEQRAYDAHGNQNREINRAVLRLQDLLVRRSPDAPAPEALPPQDPTARRAPATAPPPA